MTPSHAGIYHDMKRVILESPYAGEIAENVRYARECMRDSLSRGEAPIASHLLYTQEGILRDEIAAERQWGIEAGLCWRPVADYSVFYTDRGWSGGMIGALNSALVEKRQFFVRALYGEPRIPSTFSKEAESVVKSSIETTTTREIVMRHARAM